MVPKVRVPADFGVHHLQCPAHCNLTLKLKDGSDMKANSMILSYNSPVVEHFTTNLLQTSLDVDDFEAGAVQRFVESLYTGELEQANRDNFRDINKLANVFQVSWLVDRCVGFFKEQISKVCGSEYNDILFLVEEARFVMTTLKSTTFLELVILKMETMKKERNSFVERYVMADFNNASKDQMNLVIKLMGSDVHVLVGFLTEHLVANTLCLHDNSRYLLESMDMLACYRKDRTVYNLLTTTMGEIDVISKEDFTMLLKLHQQLANPTAHVQPQPVLSAVSSMIPNLFTTFDYFYGLSFDELIEELSVSPDVLNLYMFVDAVWLWLHENNGRLVKWETNELYRKIETAKRNRGWDKVLSAYVDSFDSRDVDTKQFINLMKKSTDLITEDDNYQLGIYCCMKTSVTKAVIENGGKFTVNLNGFSNSCGYLNCTKKGCSIILNVTPATKNDYELFDINLCTDPNEYYKQKSHFHQDLIFANKMHICIRRKVDRNWQNLPLSWCGKPQLDTTGAHWGWGIHGFCGETDNPAWEGQCVEWKHRAFSNTCDFNFMLVVMK